MGLLKAGKRGKDISVKSIPSATERGNLEKNEQIGMTQFLFNCRRKVENIICKLERDHNVISNRKTVHRMKEVVGGLSYNNKSLDFF